MRSRTEFHYSKDILMSLHEEKDLDGTKRKYEKLLLQMAEVAEEVPFFA